jgi:hypothetical protein
VPAVLRAVGGSDAAAARTRAVREGDDWVINGQKVWTSGAHYSDFGLLLARTDPDVPKHKGLTMFWIDMKAPGVEVRPIHQMSGASNFNEVYFTDLRVKDSQRVGGVGEGWRVSLVTLMNERLAMGGGGGGSNHRRVLKLASDISDPHRPGSQGQRSAREDRRLVRPGGGPEVHPLPHHDRPLARPDARAGKLDRQGGLRP